MHRGGWRKLEGDGDREGMKSMEQPHTLPPASSFFSVHTEIFHIFAFLQ